MRVIRSGQKVSFPMTGHGDQSRRAAGNGTISAQSLLALWLLRPHHRAVRSCAVSSFFSTPRVG